MREANEACCGGAVVPRCAATASAAAQIESAAERIACLTNKSCEPNRWAHFVSTWRGFFVNAFVFSWLRPINHEDWKHKR